VSPEGQGLAEITLKMADGSSPATAFDVGFSPDGSRIVSSWAAQSLASTQPRLDGSDVKQLTTSPTEDHHPNLGCGVRLLEKP
jgi:hypothetical protein